MDLIKMEVGKRFPLEDINEHFSSGGASLSYDDDGKSLTLYMAIPDVQDFEADALSNDNLRFFFYESKELNTHLMIIKVGNAFEMDVLFDINVLPKNIDGRVDSNGFKIFLIDQESKILKAMRVLGLGNNFMNMINSITINDGRYTSDDYMRWIQSTYQTPLPLLITNSKEIKWNE